MRGILIATLSLVPCLGCIGCVGEHPRSTPAPFSACRVVPVDGPRESRFDHVAVTLPSGEVLVAGGVGQGGQLLDSVERGIRDGRRVSWVSEPSLPGPLAGSTAVTHEGAVLVIGGEVDRSGTASPTVLQRQLDGTWHLAPPLRRARRHPAVAVIGDGTLVVCGGSDSRRVVDSCERRDAVTGRWTTLISQGVDCRGPMSVGDDGMVFVFGCRGQWANDSYVVFSPDAAAETATIFTMPVEGGFGPPSFNLSGRVLVMGGTSDILHDSDAVYEATLRGHVRCGTLGRRHESAVPVRVEAGLLLVGGATNAIELLSRCDDARVVATLAGNLNWHTANVLPDGSVLVVGGMWDLDAGSLASAALLPASATKRTCAP